MRKELADSNTQASQGALATVWWALPRLWRIVVLVAGSWFVLALAVLGMVFASSLFT
ncbi:MAG: hypothetical protein ABL879_11955 [Devosia sp.]